MIAEKPDSLYFTSKGDARGYIQPGKLRELWFHTGTSCNLSCSFCLEGSSPGDDRISLIKFREVKPYFDEAFRLGVEKFSFTGGEPFVNRDMIKILDYALDLRPCLVLSNGTDPLIKRMKDVLPLAQKKHPLHFRISIDWPDSEKHDKFRGEGNFVKAFQTMKVLHENHFRVSIARQSHPEENSERVSREFEELLLAFDLPANIPITSFPDFLPPGSLPGVPEITENCMTHYKTGKQRMEFMCHFSKMVLKKGGEMSVYACTLVDDDENYDLGQSLEESLQKRIMLGHHRCYSCFAYGASCSET